MADDISKRCRTCKFMRRIRFHSVLSFSYYGEPPFTRNYVEAVCEKEGRELWIPLEEMDNPDRACDNYIPAKEEK